MSALKTFLISTILATTALATSHESNNGGGGGGNSWQQPPSNGGGWNSWESPSNSQSPHSTAAPVWQAAPSCPAGCIPIPTGGAPPPPPPGQLMVQVVSVADKNGSLKYFPNKISAPVGSIVQFQFHPKNHTITESSFAEPCKPLAANLTSSTRPGLRSGFIPVKGDEPFTPVYNVLVNDTKPIWIFCGQVNHCQRGMAMVINQPDGPNTIEKYIENAGKIPTVSVPAPPPAGSTGAPPPPPPPPPAATETFTFGGGGGFGGAPSSSRVGAPPVQTVATSTVPVAPATFTGAASSLNVRDASSLAGVVLGALVALL